MWCRCQTVQKTVVMPQLQFLAVVDFPVVPQRHIHMVLPVRKTIETPQLQYVAWWSIPLLCRSCFTFRREVLKTVEVPQCSSSTWVVLFMRTVEQLWCRATDYGRNREGDTACVIWKLIVAVCPRSWRNPGGDPASPWM